MKQVLTTRVLKKLFLSQQIYKKHNPYIRLLKIDKIRSCSSNQEFFEIWFAIINGRFYIATLSWSKKRRGALYVTLKQVSTLSYFLKTNLQLKSSITATILVDGKSKKLGVVVLKLWIFFEDEKVRNDFLSQQIYNKTRYQLMVFE